MASMTIHNFIRRNSPDDGAFAKATEKDVGYDHEDLPNIHLQFVEKENVEGALFPRRKNDEQMGNFHDRIVIKMKRNQEGRDEQPPQRRRRT